MRRLILLLIICMAVGVAMPSAKASNPKIEDIYTEFSAVPGATTVYINPFLTWVGKLFIGNDGGLNVAKKTKSVKVLSIEECDEATQARLHSCLSELTQEGYEELVRVNSDGDKVRIYAKIKKETINRLLISAISKKECALIYVKGKFKLSDLDDLVESHTSKHNDD